MMSSEMFASEEVIYFEGSSVEPPIYHPESHMRSYENVVYVPHILSPVMLLGYIPVYYNYQTYEPYLINRSQVFYVPFVRPVSYTYFVPYYYRYSVPEVFESSTQSEEDTSSNNYQESSLDNSLSDEVIYEDDLNSSSDQSVLSNSYSSSSYEDSEFSSGEEMCDFSQGFVCDENIHSFDGKHDEDDESNTGWEYPQEVFSAVDEYQVNEAHDPSLSLLFGDSEKNSVKSGLKCSEEKKEPSLKNVEKESELNHISPDRCDNRVNFDDKNEIESLVSSTSLFIDAEPTESFMGSEKVEYSSLENVGKERDLSHLSPDRSDNHVNLDDKKDIESLVSSTSLVIDAEPTESFIGSEKVEYSSLENVEKKRDLSHFSADGCENYINSDNSNDKDSCVSSMSSLDYVTKYQDENDFEHSELSSFKKKNVKRSESYTSRQLSVQSQETMLQKPQSLHNFDTIVPELFDDVNSESENDIDDDPAITLQDILASDEYWKVKREAYMQKRRNRDLYRSSLEGDIHPKRSLPQVGTLATIFEDLPHPINEPYDDGLQRVEETATEDHFELPPLEVERSTTALLPKKKRFRKTKKFFSGLLRCFRPPP